jgi:hypothetical protein
MLAPRSWGSASAQSEDEEEDPWLEDDSFLADEEPSDLEPSDFPSDLDSDDFDSDDDPFALPSPFPSDCSLDVEVLEPPFFL